MSAGGGFFFPWNNCGDPLDKSRFDTGELSNVRGGGTCAPECSAVLAALPVQLEGFFLTKSAEKGLGGGANP